MNRIFIRSVYILLYGFATAINHLCLALDDIFYPSYRNVVIRPPLFIVSMPRTATTWLHNILASDQQQFTSMKLWEMLLAPSVLQKKLILWLSKTDRCAGGHINRLLRNWDKRIFRGYKPVHPSSLFAVEDDDLVLFNIFSNLFLVFFFPHLAHVDFLMEFDQMPDIKRKKRILSFYRKCIQRHLYVFGEGKTYLSKSATHSPRMRSLREWFPGSLFLFTVRKPEQAVLSGIGTASHFCALFHTRFNRAGLVRRTLAMYDSYFSYPVQVLKEWPGESYFVNRYDDLVINVGREVTRIYTHFQFPVSSDFSIYLHEEWLKSKSYQSGHQYISENWGISSAEITLRYTPWYKKYENLIHP